MINAITRFIVPFFCGFNFATIVMNRFYPSEPWFTSIELFVIHMAITGIVHFLFFHALEKAFEKTITLRPVEIEIHPDTDLKEVQKQLERIKRGEE